MNIVLIIDLIIILYILYKVGYCSKKGFMYTAVQLIGTVATWICSWYYSSILAQMIYDKGLRELLYEKVSENGAYFITTSQEAFFSSVEHLFEQLSPMLSSIMTNSLLTYGEEIFTLSPDGYSGTEHLVEEVMTGLVDPLALGILRGIAFLSLFILIRIAFSLILPLFKGINRIPVIGTLNSFLGGASGLVLGGVNVYIATGFLWVLLTFFSTLIPFFTTEQLSQTILLRLFYNSLPWMG